MTIVTFTHITKTYPKRDIPVLDDFSLEVKSGELVSLLGPSGIGKSTLLKLIAGIEKPDAGDILFNSESILPIAPNQREAVFMFQKAYLFPFLSVGENIEFGLKVKGFATKARLIKVAEMLDLIGLPGIENRRPNELSGGEQQRVALARSLVIRPKVLLLDEPFNSLDRPVRLNLQEAVRNIQRELGITTILVTHDLEEAMSMSDRMALMMGGKVAAVDTPQLLFQKPPSVETAKFVGVKLFIEGVASSGTLVSAEWGELRIEDDAKAGRSVYAIRPEHFRVIKEKSENSFSGVVQNSVYRGEHIEMQVALSQKKIRVHLPAEKGVFSSGTPVEVLLPKKYLFVVEE
ncbi:MAG: ABC transporter ATP-binding protein [Anaerolineae bacterium]|jgi:ABC-type Fe3+/spermidine/putrescine transport system ATPase subunit|nr:ABC transporter ATP-binding protein [Anaerolineae bacterium]MBT7781586.1 ABC transporter ATP-binding protein [Anaerolineae bacterium]